MKLGQINEEERELALKRIEEMKAKMPVGSGIPDNFYEVAVAVYVNGHLQYHGGQTVACNGPLDRKTAKTSAVFTLKSSMNEIGDCEL